MRYRGVVYDVGLRFSEPALSVEPFDPNLVTHDMNAIAKDLHTNAVRIEGEDIHRLETASRIAHAAGLAVFFNPWKMNASIEECQSYYGEAAMTAEQLRADGIDIVFVAGCEYTIFNKGVFPGETFQERVAWFAGSFGAGAESMPEQMLESVLEKSKELNESLRSFVAIIRQRFTGPVTYSAGSWEAVDWDIFDIVGVDHYRRGESEEKYVGSLDKHRLGKPLIVMEVGCCAYVGAGPRGDGGFALLQGTNPDGTGIFKDGVVPVRSEEEQAEYVGTQLQLLDGARVDGVFAYVFSFPSMPLGTGDRDMDMMCFSFVKTFPKSDPRSDEMPPWAPKKSFYRLAEVFKQAKGSIADGVTQ